MKNNSKEERSDCSLSVEDIDPLCFLGPADCNLAALSRHYRTRFVCRGGQLILSGPKSEETEVQEVLARLLDRCRRGEAVTPDLVDAEVSQVRRGGDKGTRHAIVSPVADKPGHVPGEVRTLRTPRKVIVPKTRNQQDYLEAIRHNDVVLCIGPAGTGKTYLAVAAALESLVSGRSSRIVLTRPAVEAGESLGYLPGTFKEKVDPYLRPLYDALFDMMPMERTKRMIEEEVIEVAPLAFMRGRTLSDAYIILDEAQNTIPTQMRMFLTRLGWNSKAIVTGDITQIDLAKTHVSGLVEAEERLRGIPGIAIVHMTKADVVRPPLVSRIIKAYEARPEPGKNEG